MAQRLNVISKQLSVAHKPEVDMNLVEVELIEDKKIAIIYFNRPKELNALNDAMIAAMNETLRQLDTNPSIGCIILSGRGRAFAAGADIKEMCKKTVADMVKKDKIAPWEEVLPNVSKPVIAAVNGFAFGGGCEIAMMCDIIIASDKAQFGQPEIKLGLIAGAGGTQRLSRAVGKSLSMLMNLTGEPVKPERLLQANLVAEVVAHDDLMSRCIEIASNISRHSQPVATLCKESVSRSFETNLKEGMRAERRNFHLCFGLEDAREGMAAFTEKRKANFKNL
eukprot:GDKJ01019221.1.p1 GENE.GDKJ01019221.1~~GDKJ01019221.1.p1  ORF type:complete len:280 (-),score=66.10 GDKJ01019221.1:136-975(-)